MPLRIATWNINSVRLRIDLVARLVDEHAPDILCLQEIKCSTDNFPARAFRDLGYHHIAVNGQKGYHGVAIASRVPFVETWQEGFCDKDDARHIAARFSHGGTEFDLHDFYIPAGGDEPDPEINDKFAHKLSFLDEFRGFLETHGGERRALVVGDLNVAPLEHDVWSHRQLLKVVSHTPVETEKLEEARRAGGLVDVMRRFVPPEEKLYTWWSYRAKDWKKADRGRRLDHVWATPALDSSISAIEVLTDARGWDRPSDHVPVIATLA
ncbi:MAG TPA: exodeoxyribonuclease III [Kaistiaceae bacterium]|nr:exodeoxyribonuclease III [Kaistiaceae bacterium]